MNGPAISVETVSFAYGAHQALKGISFEIAPGEVLGFLGPNGAGKSTTVKLLTGQLKPSAGRIRVLGQEVSGDGGAVRSRIGVCFEEKNLYLNMSAVENLAFFAALFGIRKPDIMGLLRDVDLADRARDRVHTYSKGMRQRLMIARALINQPEVLLLDEPTSGLDPVSAKSIRTIIQRRAAAGAAILLTTHDMWVADELSTRVAFINEGRIYALDTPENLKLVHGRRSVRLRLRENGEVRDRVIPLDGAGAGEALKEAIAADNLLTVHSEEATLEQVFIKMTGRGLQ